MTPTLTPVLTWTLAPVLTLDVSLLFRRGDAMLGSPGL